MLKACLSVLVFTSIFSMGLSVNRLNGGLAIYYIDLSVVDSPFVMELSRGYNNLSALSESRGWSGAFGWGWNSPLETTLSFTPEKNIIIRDGTSGNAILFKPQKEDPRATDKFLAVFGEAYQRESGRKPTPKLILKMRKDAAFRIEMALKYNLQSSLPVSDNLVSNEYGFQTLTKKGNEWVRGWVDGSEQTFDSDGRLKKFTDKRGLPFTLTFNGNEKFHFSRLQSNVKPFTIEFTWKGDRIIQAKDSRGKVATYTYSDNGNLIRSSDSNAQIYSYEYGNKRFPHLLTKITYLSEQKDGKAPIRELRYDNNGLLVYHRDKDGSETQYVYGRGVSDPENVFTTRSVKKAYGRVEEKFEEFTVKARADGTKYLYKMDTRQGSEVSSTTYTECCSKPLVSAKNGVAVNFKYNDRSQLIERRTGKEIIKIEYDPRWKKISKINQNGFVSDFKYDKRGNLVAAQNTKGQKISLVYNRLGQIEELVSNNGKHLTLKYNSAGKPTLISEKGVGMVRVDYSPEGLIQRALTTLEGKKPRKLSPVESQELIGKVLGEFEAQLNIIRPAGKAYVEMTE